jgi:hypothetical protein
MGDWMTVTIVGRIHPAEAAAAREFVNTGEDLDRFHCLCNYGPSLCGLGDWVPEQGGEIRAVGNCSERNYSSWDVAEVLERMVAVAPSLELKVHCGGPNESPTCTATITVYRRMVTIGPPEVEIVGEGLVDLAAERLGRLLGSGDSIIVRGGDM